MSLRVSFPTARSGALRTVSVLVLLTSTSSYGQEQPTLEEVVVVGSRIVKPDFRYSNPVLSVSAEDLEVRGTNNLVGYLKTVPALTASFDSNASVNPNSSFIGSTGGGFLDLRNLGIDRTLVLVDGRRHVAGLPGSAAVDVNTIPIGLVERVEVMTGGASAVYGADGVTGVVNFVMKDHYEGINLRAQGGISDEDDNESGLFSLIAGKNFDKGRGNITFAAEYNKENRLKGTDRDFAAGGDRSVFVTNPFEEVPNEIPLKDIRFFDSSLPGAFDTDADFGAFTGTPDFDGTDQPWDAGDIPFIDPFLQQGGDGTPLDSYVGDLLPEEERVTLNLMADYKLSDAVNLFTELKYSNTQSFARNQPSFDFFLALQDDYPYLSPNIRSALEQAQADGTYDPFGEADFFGVTGPLVSRDHVDLGLRDEDIERETVRTVFGINGDFADGFTYEVSYVYGETEVTNEAGNNRFNDRFAAALDAVIDPATGEPTCRSNLDPDALPVNLDWMGWLFDYEPRPGTWAASFTPGPGSGCVPLNIVGDGSPSQEAQRWIMQTTESESEITQHVVQGFVTGSSERWFSLPAGPVYFVAGAEYREEESESTPAAEDRAGYTFGNVIEPVEGDFDVTEVFVEVDVPLLSGQPWADVLSVDAAVRYSDYSTIGSATTWKVGGVWQPVEDIRFRGTVAEATRAPNIAELFDPGGQTFQFITDPCDINEVNNGSDSRQANCNALLTSLGVDPDTYTDPNSSSIAGTVSGNENLDEEEVDTWTVGIILEPRFIPNLKLSIDYYDIELKDAINTATPQEGADLCVDLPTLDNDYCDSTTREPGFGGIVDFVQAPFNVASLETEGYDFTVEYFVDPGEWGATGDWGVFNFRIVGNKLEELEFVNLPGAAPDDDLGEPDAPEWQLNFDLTWQRGPLLVNYRFEYFDETKRYTAEERQANPDIAARRYWDYDEMTVHNIFGAWDFNDRYRLSGGINNFTDEEPDIGETFYPVSAVGIYYFLALEASF